MKKETGGSTPNIYLTRGRYNNIVQSLSLILIYKYNNRYKKRYNRLATTHGKTSNSRYCFPTIDSTLFIENKLHSLHF